MVETDGQETEKLEITNSPVVESIPATHKEDVVEIDMCKLIMDTEGNIHMECKQPTEKLKISKQELDMLQGLSEIVPNKE